MSEGLSLGGVPLSMEDHFHIGVLVGAVVACRSVMLDSTNHSVALIGAPNFAATVLAIEHFRRRSAGRVDKA